MTRPLFEHLPDLGEALAGSPRIWLGTDFDGTLTHHQDDPETVALPAAMRERLARLAAHPRFAVAVISGRSLCDLMPRVGLPELAYAGNHGLEVAAPGLRWTHPTAARAAEPLAACAAVVAGFIPAFPGATLENKRLSLAIDYRPCPPPLRREIAQRVEAAVAEFPALRVRHAPLGSEVLPVCDANKGTAARVLREHQLRGGGMAIYLGDDLTDEDAFRALPEAVTVHVGGRATAARFRVESADTVGVFFDWLLGEATLG